MAGILPQSGTQQFDNATGTFLTGGQLFVYEPATTTPAAIFSTLTLSPGSELPSPIILDTAGRIPAVYAANGSVRVRILNAASVLQTDIDNVPIVSLNVFVSNTAPVATVIAVASGIWLAARSLTVSVPVPSPTTRLPANAFWPAVLFRSNSPAFTVVVPE